MHQFAQIATLSREKFHVVIMWQDDEGVKQWQMPSINIPAKDFDHACRIVDAINSELCEA